MKYNKFSINVHYFCGAVITFFLLAGCATTKPVGPSGFLGDYSKLVPVPGETERLYSEKPNVNWKKYTKLMFDPVMVYYHPDAKNNNINPDELKKLTDYFRDQVVKAVEDTYPVVDASGPDVLRIRAAITNVVPVDRHIEVLSISTVYMYVDMGGATMEAELLDSVSNERLAAVVDRRKGAPINTVQDYTKWVHAKEAFRYWAKEFKRSLDLIRY